MPTVTGVIDGEVVVDGVSVGVDDGEHDVNTDCDIAATNPALTYWAFELNFTSMYGLQDPNEIVDTASVIMPRSRRSWYPGQCANTRNTSDSGMPM